MRAKQTVCWITLGSNEGVCQGTEWLFAEAIKGDEKKHYWRHVRAELYLHIWYTWLYLTVNNQMRITVYTNFIFTRIKQAHMLVFGVATNIAGISLWLTAADFLSPLMSTFVSVVRSEVVIQLSPSIRCETVCCETPEKSHLKSSN